MGWLSLRAGRVPYPAIQSSLQEDLKSATQQIDAVSNNSGTQQGLYSSLALGLSNSELPFIVPEEVARRKSVQDGCIFIDDVVYDCTTFIHRHPGGEQMIHTFAGSDCSWQFWRFHTNSHIEEYGKPLRVGRTRGLMNKFKEPKKFIGLRRLGGDPWD